MSTLDFEIKFFGWAHNEAKGNDKIWGWVVVEGKLYNFWGRRGDLDKQKALKFKKHDKQWGSYELGILTKKKQKPSGDKTPYLSVGLAIADDKYTDIEKIYPNFTQHFLRQLMWARLSGNVKGEEF